MKRLALIALICAAVLVASAPAFAFQLVDIMGDGSAYQGAVKFKLNGVTSSLDTINGFDPNFFNLSTTGLYNYGTAENPVYSESWGIAEVTNIVGIDINSVVWQGSPNERIYAIIYGLYDNTNTTETSSTYDVYQSGGFFKLFLDTNNNGFPDENTPAGRLSDGGYDGVTNMGYQLFLSGNFVPGVTTDGITTVTQELSMNTAGGWEGEGRGYADVTSGDYASMFDSDVFNGQDLYFNFDITPYGGGYNWSFTIDDPVYAQAVPEPTSMLLFGLGLVGAALRRRFNV